MNPIDYRNDTWEIVQGRMLADLRYQVWQAFRNFGPGTTRDVAKKSGIDLLTLRPRTTELYQLGCLTVAGEGNEGIYTALSYDQVREKFFNERRRALGYQPELQFK
jgi:hypothetical protein